MIVVMTYNFITVENPSGELVEREYGDVFQINTDDSYFISIVFDVDGETHEEMIRKTDVIDISVSHGEDLIGRAKQARAEYEEELERQARQARINNAGLQVIK